MNVSQMYDIEVILFLLREEITHKLSDGKIFTPQILLASYFSLVRFIFDILNEDRKLATYCGVTLSCINVS